MNDLYQFTACEMVVKLKAGAVSIQDALDCLETRITQVDSSINALPTLCFERARQSGAVIQSLPVSQRGILCGLPVTIKDLTPVAGVRTTHGSRVFEDHVPKQSDQLVDRIESRGGVVYAKSNTPEFGTGGITFNDVFGVTRNPRNTSLASGGSSGGAAASLASGCAWLSHGSDMAGSLRTPAGFCGVTSLRPSPGRISADSTFLPFDVLGADGPMARNVEDLGLFADAMMSGTDSMLEAASSPLKPITVAVTTDFGITQVSDEVSKGFHGFIESLAAQDVRVVEACPDLHSVHKAFDTLRAQSYAVNLEQTLFENPGVMKPEIVWNIESGLELTAEDIRHALRTQGQVVNRSASFMQDFDILICPATSVISVPAESRYPGFNTGVPISDYYRWLAVAYATTLTALPIITLPCGTDENGLPIGVQVVGKPGGEYSLFQYARWIERLTGWPATPIDPVIR